VRGGGWPWGSSRERVACLATPGLRDGAKDPRARPPEPSGRTPAGPPEGPRSHRLKGRSNRLCSRGTMATKKKAKVEDVEPEGVELEEDDSLGEDDLDVDIDDADALEDIEVDALEDEDDDLVVLDDEEDEVDADVDEILTASPAAVVERTGEGDEEEEEEEPDDEDVEASLDVILKERLVVEDEPEDEEATDQEDKTEGNERVLPKQPDEFVCRSCFLVKHPSQLADKKNVLCRDCV